jgi:hypothetical protein
MKPDEFEQQLQSQPLRSVPSEWRAEILGAAHAARAAHEPRVTRQATIFPLWRKWLWPSPQAWAALAAVWMVLIALHLAGPPMPPSIANQSPSPEKRMAVAAQRRELARLLDVPADSAPAPEPTVPGPRSERTLPSKV